MASGPITSWEIDGETLETVSDFVFWFFFLGNARLQIGKRVRQGCILSPCSFNLYAEYIMRNAGLEEAQARIKIAVRNINNLRYWLKAQHSENKDHGIWSHHFMGNRWGNRRNSVKLYFGGLQNLCRW